MSGAPCGRGKKAKRCCGARRGPSDAKLVKAFLAIRSREAAVRLVRYSSSTARRRVSTPFTTTNNHKLHNSWTGYRGPLTGTGPHLS